MELEENVWGEGAPSLVIARNTALDLAIDLFDNAIDERTTQLTCDYESGWLPC